MKLRRTEYIAAAVVLGVIFGMAVRAEAVPRIMLNAYSEIAGEKILLGEIASISGLEAEKAKALGTLSLGPSPRPDNDITLSRRQMETRLYEAGIERGEYELAIPDKVTLKRKAVRVSGKSIADFAVDFLQNSIVWPGGQVTVKVKSLPSDVILPLGDVSLTGVLEGRPDQYGARNFRVDVFLDGKKVRAQGMSSFIEVLGEVMTAAAAIPTGGVLGEADLVPKEMSLDKLRPGAIVSSADAVGKKARRTIAAGDVIYRTALDIQPDVKAGDAVTIIINGQGFQVSSNGKALEKGFKGELIKVAPTGSKKVLQGVILDSQTVEALSSN